VSVTPLIGRNAAPANTVNRLMFRPIATPRTITESNVTPGWRRRPAHGEARVLPDALEPRPEPDGARVLACARDIAKLAPGGQPGVFSGEPPCLELLPLQRAMELELLTERVVLLAVPQQVEETS
jgi:hypothetical protein